MADNSTLIAISAFSGLAGALLTQMISGLFAYFSERRKYNNGVRDLHRAKKIEIGENFYYITGEKMTIVKKNIGYWKNWNNSRSEASLDYLKKEMITFKAYIDKLNEENWKYNLISLYYNVSFTSSEVLEANEQSHLYYLSVLDLMDKIKKANGDETEVLYQQYAIAIFDMCAHYENVYEKMKEDMNIVKNQLLTDFGLTV
ncbi:hypothetical protein [Mucilaginibacter jinjuensis]|uniref:Phage abortive infection protein n=1 Tax=Mucilaginibacter jinjuensis TaxID=1176721 RepID=A0ABY7TCF1_9SPHI|nr:hypothetical protein [Mucilaginibacter jinjuensis]WCT13750.1 hypothetical protein PQO05_07355 [Mucilaginibacter jinjuensis]